MMTDWYFHILDIAHGIVMAVLVFFIFRLLVFRKEGALREPRSAGRLHQYFCRLRQDA